jgi:RNA polymerase sigma factor (sigma-70 family)
MSGNESKNKRESFRPFWSKTIEENLPKMTSYARRLANGNYFNTQDLVQEAACRILTYCPDPSRIKKPRDYILRSIRNVWTSKWRKEKQAETESLDDLQSRTNWQRIEPAEECNDIQQILEDKEMLELLKANLGPLNKREKLLLALFLKGLKCKKIAIILNEDPRAISFDLNKVRNKVNYRLRQRFNK